MADDLINKLAAQIKARDESAAKAQQIQLHKTEFIQTNCAQWFHQFMDAFVGSAQALNKALTGSASADPPIKAGIISPQQISVTKDDFPAVRVNSLLDVRGMSVNVAASSAAQKGQTPKEWSLHLQFDVDANNNLVLRSKPGTPTFQVSTPKELADSLMETVFSV